MADNRYGVGALFRVIPTDGKEFLPCLPVPGECNARHLPCTRLLRGELVKVVKYSEMEHSAIIEVSNAQNQHVLVERASADRAFLQIRLRNK